MTATTRFAVAVGVGVALTVAVILATERKRSPAAKPIPTELSGCAAIVDEGVCELAAEGELRVWAAAPIALENATVLREENGAVLYRVKVAPGTQAIDVAGRTIRVAPRVVPPWLEKARALRKANDVAGALALSTPNETSGDAANRAFASGFHARIELGAGHIEDSFSLFRNAVRLHRVARRPSDAADDSFALAFALNQRSHRYAEARAVLDEVKGDLGAYPDGRVREAYYRGTLAMETGDARAALALLGAARNEAARLGLSLLERNAINAYAEQLALVGRTEEALGALRRLEADAEKLGASGCERTEIAINIAFGALLANERANDTHEDALAPLEHARASAKDCKDTFLLTPVLGNLAIAALQRHDVAAARAYLAEAQGRTQEVRATEVLAWRDIEGELALAENDATKALFAFEEEDRIARSTNALEPSWRAALGKAEALELAGKSADAVLSYRRAESILDELGFVVPLGEGRGTFLGDRSRSARLGIDLLVRLGKNDEALAMARRSRRRLVAQLARSAKIEGLDPAGRAKWELALGAYRTARSELDAAAKDDWKLTKPDAVRSQESRREREAKLRAALDEAMALAGGTWEDVPARKDGVLVAFHPVRRGWVMLVADGRKVKATSLGSIEPAEIAKHVPRDGRRLDVLPYGAVRALDIHALTIDGTPLIALAPVAYPLDLPDVPPSSSDRAVVVFDPSLDLEAARREAGDVEKTLLARGWSVDALGGAEATSAALLGKLVDARFLHYAGHGVFAGREAIESELPLAGGSKLAISDVLAAAHVPDRVVLSGCDTARAADAPGESLGMAQAFVVRGSSFVIAPTRPIDDKLAPRLMSALYAGLADKGPIDAATLLRDAQLRLLREDPSLDWSAFRLVTR